MSRCQGRTTESYIFEADLMVFSELAAMFPDRAGAEVVYLEKAYPRPRYLIPTAFAVCAVLLSSVPFTSILSENNCTELEVSES